MTQLKWKFSYVRFMLNKKNWMYNLWESKIKWKFKEHNRRKFFDFRKNEKRSRFVQTELSLHIIFFPLYVFFSCNILYVQYDIFRIHVHVKIQFIFHFSRVIDPQWLCVMLLYINVGKFGKFRNRCRITLTNNYHKFFLYDILFDIFWKKFYCIIIIRLIWNSSRV